MLLNRTEQTPYFLGMGYAGTITETYQERHRDNDRLILPESYVPPEQPQPKKRRLGFTNATEEGIE